MLRDFAKIALLVFAVLALSACKEKNRVPYVLVDVTLLIDLPAYTGLTAPGGYAEITGGSRGIVVYRINQQEFVAFDRHCTFQPEDNCQIHVDEDTGITANCECCTSVFSIYDGTPIEGLADRSLVKYSTSFNGNTNQLRIFN